MIYLYLTISSILAAIIEYWRIRQYAGKVQNVNHTYSVAIGAVLILTAIVICWPPLTWRIGLYVAAGICIRGVLYSPLLNKLRGLDWDYESATTSSKIDRAIGFWPQRLLFAAGVLVTVLIDILL